MLRIPGAGLLVVASLHAGLINPLPITTLAGAPVVAVCRVESVQRGALVKGVSALYDERHTIATLRVLRSMPELKALQIVLHYSSSNGAAANGHPSFARLEIGESYVFPLAPEGDHWRLLVDEGWGLVAPAIEAMPGEAAPASKRDFILREILHLLLRGSYADLFRFSTYMQMRRADELNDEIMRGLTARLADGDGRWLDISTALLGNVGIPRQKLHDFLSNGPAQIWPFAASALAARTLREVPESGRREGVLRNMVRYSAIHEWGSAATLVPEFKDDPLLLQLLPGYLRQHQKGAFLIAYWLVNNGQTALLDLTMGAALRVLNDKNADYGEVNPACRLLVERGSDRQFDEYLGALRESKVHDVSRYGELWQVAWEGKPPRVLRILAVVLDDERVASKPGDPIRYCDFAGYLVQKIAGEDFGFRQWDQMPAAERQPAVLRARAWMKRNEPR